MALFGGKRDSAKEWRGRSAELEDAGVKPWQVVWEALAMPVPDPGGGAMSALGLRGLRVGGRGDPTSTFHGERHGRWVQIRQIDLGHGRLQMLVWVGSDSPSYAIAASDGRLVAHAAPTVIARQSRAHVWNDMECHAGSFGIVVHRTVTTNQPQGWMYDLWLAEALAAGTPPLPPLPGDPAEWPLPR